ncbi:MAG: BrnT family toxin [Bdellovibrionota bacterium]
MKNKLKSNTLNLEFINGLEKENTMYYILGIVVRWDLKKGDGNSKKHGVTFEEAASLFYADITLELEDHRHSEQRFIIIGFSLHTRLLTVVYAYRLENEIRIISARKATKNEAKKYEERI